MLAGARKMIDNNLDNNGKLSIRILNALEDERSRIARDIHDSTLQNLTNLIHKTEYCTKVIDIDPIIAKLELQTMVKTIKSTNEETREIVYNLRPMSIDDLGLVDTIDRYVFLLNQKPGINYKISFKLLSKEKKQAAIVNLSLFRIIQEAVNNAIYHGKAKKIEIFLEYKENHLILKICDNGIGFDVDLSKSQNNSLRGLGLSIMRERVNILSGKITIVSKINEGTQIKIIIPTKLTQEAI